MIDAVITWVDGTDPSHAARREAMLTRRIHPDAAASTRFASLGELRYSVLSILRFAPFVRRVHIVTDQQEPHPIADLLCAHPERLQTVDHRQIYAEHSDLLPVFSSRSIETMIHRIPDLAERFIYLNDDIFIGRPVEESHYFDGDRPVLKGRMRKLPHPVWKKIKGSLRRERPGYGLAQRGAAEVLGRQDYLLVEHQPQPMRRSTLAHYYEGRRDALRTQAGYPFRSSQQISPIGLSHHLELAAGSRYHEPEAVGYVRPGRPTGSDLKDRMQELEAGAFASFCVQSLNEMNGADQEIVLNALERHYDV